MFTEMLEILARMQEVLTASTHGNKISLEPLPWVALAWEWALNGHGPIPFKLNTRFLGDREYDKAVVILMNKVNASTNT